MAIVNGYATAAELKGHLGIDQGDTRVDAHIDRAVNAASRAIDAYTLRRFWQDSGVSARTYATRCVERLDVDDISTTTGLVVKADDNDDGVFEVTWAATDYELDPTYRGGIEGWPYERFHAISRWFPIDGQRRYRTEITARWGWAAVPVLVYESCLLVAADLFKRRDAPFGVAGFGEFGSIRIRTETIDAAGSMLDRFRRADQFGIA